MAMTGSVVKERGCLRGLPVLIVEDDRSSARLLSALTGWAGCETRVAYNAEEGLAALETFPAQVVVVDLVLPGMSGLLMARLLKSDPTKQAIVILAVSGVEDPSVAQLAREAGCSAYVPKPIDTELFLDALYRTSQSILYT